MLSDALKERIFAFRQALWSVAKFFIADQITKWYFIGQLQNSRGFTIKVTDFLDFVYVWNYGISFGLFKGYYQYSNLFFGIINSTIVIYLCYLLYKEEVRLTRIAYIAIIGGALGNLADRFFRGAVFDFIRFHKGDLSFSIFNLADAFISCGIALLVYVLYISKNKKKDGEESSEEEENQE